MTQDEQFDNSLWDVAERSVPKLYELEEYKTALDKLAADETRMCKELDKKLDDEHHQILRDIDTQESIVAYIENELAYREIFFYGMHIGIEMCKRNYG